MTQIIIDIQEESWAMEHGYNSIEPVQHKIIPRGIEYLINSMQYNNLLPTADRTLLEAYLAQRTQRFQKLPDFLLDYVQKNAGNNYRSNNKLWFTQRFKGKYSVASLENSEASALTISQISSHSVVSVPIPLLEKVLLTVKLFNDYQDQNYQTKTHITQPIQFSEILKRITNKPAEPNEYVLMNELHFWLCIDATEFAKFAKLHRFNIHVFRKLVSLFNLRNILLDFGIAKFDYILRPRTDLNYSNHGASELYYLVDTTGEYSETPIFAVKSYTSYENGNADDLQKEFTTGYVLSWLGLTSFIKVYGFTKSLSFEPDLMWTEFIGFSTLSIQALLIKDQVNVDEFCLCLALLISDLIIARKNGIFMSINPNSLFIQSLPEETNFTLVTGHTITLEIVLRSTDLNTVDPSVSIVSQIFDLLVTLTEFATIYDYQFFHNISSVYEFLIKPKYDRDGRIKNKVDSFSAYKFIRDLRTDDELPDIINWILKKADEIHPSTLSIDAKPYNFNEVIPDFGVTVYPSLLNSSWERGDMQSYIYYVLFYKKVVPLPTTIQNGQDLIARITKRTKQTIFGELYWLKHAMSDFNPNASVALATIKIKNIGRSIYFIVERLRAMQHFGWINKSYITGILSDIIRISSTEIKYFGLFRVLVFLIKKQQKDHPDVVDLFNAFVDFVHSFNLEI